jgi:hypothetical protein
MPMKFRSSRSLLSEKGRVPQRSAGYDFFISPEIRLSANMRIGLSAPPISLKRAAVPEHIRLTSSEDMSERGLVMWTWMKSGLAAPRATAGLAQKQDNEIKIASNGVKIFFCIMSS